VRSTVTGVQGSPPQTPGPNSLIRRLSAVVGRRRLLPFTPPEQRCRARIATGRIGATRTPGAAWTFSPSPNPLNCLVARDGLAPLFGQRGLLTRVCIRWFGSNHSSRQVSPPVAARSLHCHDPCLQASLRTHQGFELPHVTTLRRQPGRKRKCAVLSRTETSSPS
jgi:hypothetical protein